MSLLTIRAATAHDFDAWLTLWRGYQTFYKTDIAQSTTVATWQRLLDAAEPMHVALAEMDGSAIGFVHFIEHRSCWTVGNYMYLQDLFVDPAVRGHGAGRALIEHVYAQARERGCSRVWWLTHETNEQAMALYNDVAERSGFVQYRKQV